MNSSSTNSFTDTSVGEGSAYWYKIVATNGLGSADASQAAQVSTPPSAPASFQATGVTATQAVLTWTNTSHDATGFDVERSGDNGGSWSDAGQTDGSTFTLTDTTLNEGQSYLYRVSAVGAGGNSDASNTISVNANPAAPTGLSISAASATSVVLNWTDVSNFASNYVVARSGDNGQNFTVIATLGGSANSYTDTVTEGGSYQYEVRASQTGQDGNTVILSDWTPAQAVVTPPAAPSNVQPVYVSAFEVDVAWTNNSSAQTGFKIERSTDNESWTVLGTALASQQSYQDTTVSAGTQYYYRVRAVGAGGDSQPSDSAAVTSVPVAPGNLQTSTAANPSVTLNWNDVAAETGFNLHRSTDGGQSWTSIGSTLAGVTTFTDTTSVEDASYLYAVSAINAGGESTLSQPASATTFLAAPTGLGAVAASTSVTLNWTDHSVAATGIEVQRGDASGQNWQTLVSLSDSSATTYTDSTAADGTQYTYRVRALSIAGNSDFAPSITTTTSLEAPSDLMPNTLSSNAIQLTWTNNATNVTGFGIYRSTDGGTSFSQIDAVSGSATSYTDFSVMPGQTVQYQVVASNALVNSPASQPVTATALATAPSNLNVQPVSTTSLGLTWQDNSTGAAGYQIYRSDDGGNNFSLIFTTGPTDTSYTDSGLVEGTSHQYKVNAINAGGVTDFTNVSGNLTLCNAPENLAVTSVAANTVSLSWNNNSANAAGYAVAVSTDGFQTYSIATQSLNSQRHVLHRHRVERGNDVCVQGVRL